LTLDMSEAGNASFNGTVTANAGVVVDNITIDGTEIDLSSGDLTLDVAGDIILDADGGDVFFADGGTNIGGLKNASSDFKIESKVQDKDIKFDGNDGGSGITALTLDMSDAGTAIFNHDITLDGKITGASQVTQDSDTSSVAIAGGTDSNVGANMTVFGGSHSSLAGIVRFRNGSTETARIDSSGNLLIGRTSAGDTGNGHSIRGGDSAIFSRDASGETMQIGRNNDAGDIVRFKKNGTVIGAVATDSSGNLVIDSPNDIAIDADGSDIRLLDGGTEWGRIQNGTGSQLILQSKISDEDMLFQGNDGGSTITALTLDMSSAGEAFFNNDVNVSFQRGYQVEGGSGNSKVRFTTTTGDGGANTVLVYWVATYGSDMSGGCLGAYNRSNVYSAPTASISSSNQFAIYGVIGV